MVALLPVLAPQQDRAMMVEIALEGPLQVRWQPRLDRPLALHLAPIHAWDPGTAFLEHVFANAQCGEVLEAMQAANKERDHQAVAEMDGAAQVATALWI